MPRVLPLLARREDMSYKIAAIDIHKRVLMVVVARMAEDVEDATGAAVGGQWSDAVAANRVTGSRPP